MEDSGSVVISSILEVFHCYLASVFFSCEKSAYDVIVEVFEFFSSCFKISLLSLAFCYIFKIWFFFVFILCGISRALDSVVVLSENLWLESSCFCSFFSWSTFWSSLTSFIGWDSFTFPLHMSFKKSFFILSFSFVIYLV